MATERQHIIEATLAAAAGQSTSAQAAAVEAAIPAPSQADAGFLWRALVIILGTILVISVVGIVWTVLDSGITKTPDVILTVFTAALTGLLGLFVKPPAA